METKVNVVVDGTKMSDEQLGKLTRRSDELKRRINEGTLEYDWVAHELQRVIEGPTEAVKHPTTQSALTSQLRELIVDCDVLPNIPSGFFLESEGTEHRKTGKMTLEKRADGKFYANGVKVVRYLSPNQKNGKVIQGYKLRTELKKKQVLNACILDALLAHQKLIPDEWKIGHTYFWGTIFRDADGNLLVPSLSRDGDGWYWDCDWLDNDWFGYEPAASLANFFVVLPPVQGGSFLFFRMILCIVRTC